MNMKRQLLPSLLLFAVLLVFTSTAVFAATIMTTMRTDRAVKAGADECYRTVTNITAGETVKLLGRNESGSWVFIWADVGDGWVPAASVNVSAEEVTTLSVWTDHFNGEACSSPPLVDARICGRAGDDTTATTTRWTDIYSTADPDQPTGRSYPPNTDLTLNGRDFWGCFVRVRSNTANGNGWIPVQALDTRAVMSLPVLVDNSGGCQIINGQIINCNNSEDNTQGDIRTVRGETPIYNEPNSNTPTGRTVPADGRVRVVSERNDGWVRIRSRYGNGYIQVEQLNPPSAEDSQGRMIEGSNLHTEPDTDAATSIFVPQGTQITIVRFSSGWIFISAPQGDGWVPARTVSR